MPKYWDYWDAGHYLFIAKNGYSSQGDVRNLIVFQPLFPYILRLVSHSYWLEQILIGLMAVIGIISFYKLVRLELNKKNSILTTLSLLLFPTSFFFLLPYPEGLFLALFSLSFYFSRKNKWFLSGLFAGLAVITRPFGILIAPSLLFSIKWKRNNIVKMCILVFPSIIAYLFYLSINFSIYHDPFAYVKILHDHWYKSFSLPWNGIFLSLKRFFIVKTVSLDDKIMIGLSEAITSIIAWVLVIPAWKKLDRSMAIYYILSVFMMTSTWFIMSTPRYLLSIPPFFVLVNKITNKKLKFVLSSLSFIGLVYLFSRFATAGKWAF